MRHIEIEKDDMSFISLNKILASFEREVIKKG